MRISDFVFTNNVKIMKRLKFRNRKSEIRKTKSEIALQGSGFLQLNDQSKKSRVFWLAQATSKTQARRIAQSSIVGMHASLISQSNFPNHLCKQLCQARFGTKFTTGFGRGCDSRKK